MIHIRNNPLPTLFLAVAIFISCLSVNIAGAQNTALEPVTIQLRWSHQFQFAGYYAAIEKGFYAEEGLQVSLREFEPGTDRIAPVLEGKAQYGVGGPALLTSRVQGKPVVVLAQIFQHSPNVLLTLRESGILSAYELAGKKVMMPVDYVGSASVQAMILEILGAMDRVVIVPQTYHDDELLSGDIDAMTAYLSSGPYRLKVKGVAVNIIDPRTYGIDFYGDNLFTTENEITEQPERVNKMIRATLKGWAYALAHKDEIIDLIIERYNPDLNRDQLRYEAKVIDQMIVPDLVPIGEINSRRYDRIAKTFHQLGMSTASTVPDGFIYAARPEPTVSLTTQERAWLKAHPVITLGSPIISPWNFVDEKTGQYKGIVPDYLDLIGSKLGIAFKNIADDFGKIHQMAREKKIDGIGVAGKTAEREEFLNFAEPYITLQYSIVTQKESAAVVTFAGLAHKRTGILEASAAYAYLKKNYPDIELMTFKSYDAGMLAVLNGEIDAYVGSLAGVAYAINTKGLFGLKMAVVPFEMSREMGIGVRKDWPELITILNKAVAFIDEKEHSRIRRKWLAYSSEDQKVKQVDLTPEERAWLKSHPDITLGFADSFEPLLIVNDDGSFSGVYFDILEALNKKLGTNIGLRINSVPKILEMAQKKEVDGMLSLHPDYAAKLGLLATDGYINAYPTVFARKEANFNGPADFAGKNVAIIDKVYFSEDIIQQYGGQADIVRVTNATEGLQKVQNGSVDFFIGLSSNNFTLQKYRLVRLESKYTFFDFTDKFGYAVRSDWPTLVSILNKGISSFPEQEIESLVKKWMELPLQKQAVALNSEEVAWLDAHPDITLGYTDAFEPEVIVNPDGRYRGILVDILAELNSRLGTRIRLRIDPIPEVLEKVQEKEIDGILSILPGYAEKLGLLKTRRFITSYPTVFAHRDVSFNRPSDLAGKRVAVIDKIFFSEQIVLQHGPGATVLKVKDAKEGLQLIANGQADFFLGATLNAYLLTKHQLLDLANQYVFFDHPINNVIGTRSDWPELSAILDKGLASFSNEEIESISAKWIQFPQPKNIIQLTAKEQAWLAQKHIVQVRVVDIPPFIVLKEGGEPEGISIDYLKFIAERTGVKFKYRFSGQTFPAALDGLKKHKSPDLISSMMRTPERKESILFSNDYFRSPYVIFNHKNDKTFISDIADLYGRKIALPKGTVILEKIKKDHPDLKLVLFDSDSLAIEAVATKKADAYIGNLTLASFLILEKGLSTLKVAGPSPFGDHVFSMGIRNDWPALVSIIDKALATMSQEERAKIRNKYISIRYEHAKRMVFVKWLVTISGAALLACLLFVFWNRQLAGKVKKRTAEIRESRDYLKSLTDSMPDAVFSVNMPDWKIEWANDTFSLLGYEAAECIGRTTEFLYPSRQEFTAFGKAMAHAIAEGKEVLNLDQDLKKKNGNTFPADITMSIYKVNGEVVSVTAIVRDISERKQREQRLQKHQERLKALAYQLTVAEEKERRRIATDLHDQIGQTLALARLQLAAVRKSVSGDRLKAQIDELSESMLQATQDTRHLISDLSYPSMNEIGLTAAISEWLEEQIGKRYGLKTELIEKGLKKRLDDDVRAVLFRNVRELLINVVKHARANQVSVLVEHTDNLMKIVIRDDGIGFDYSTVYQTGGTAGGFGLFSIQERMADLGGSLEIVSEPGKGTETTLTVLLEKGR